MKAAVLTKLNEPLQIMDLLVPDLGIGQVLVDVKASGICGAQIGEITGAKGADKWLPHLLGHEGGGVVLGIGPGVTTVKPGDHVCMHWRKGEGIEAQPPQYYNDKTLKIVGGGWVTTFNEQAIISENRLTVIDKRVPFEVAALLGCAVTTGFGLVNNEAQLKIGQTIAVAGVGGVGLNVVQAASLVSASAIFAIDKNDFKLKMADAFGATDCVNSGLDPEYIMQVINERTNGKGVDVFVDCTGNTSIIDIGLFAVKPGGKLILVGQPKVDEDLTFTNMRQHYCGKTIIDSQGGLTNPTEDIPRYAQLYLDKKIDLDDLITHRYPLHQVNTAINQMRFADAGRVILTMENNNEG